MANTWANVSEVHSMYCDATGATAEASPWVSWACVFVAGLEYEAVQWSTDNLNKNQAYS